MRIIQNRPDSEWKKHIKPFLQDLKKCDLTPKTISAYQHDISLFTKWVLEISPLRKASTLTEIDIIEYRQHLLDTNLKPATINRRISSIQRLCRWLVGNKILSTDVSRTIKQVNVVSNRCPSGLKASEVQLLLQTAGQSKHGHAKRNYGLNYR